MLQVKSCEKRLESEILELVYNKIKSKFDK